MDEASKSIVVPLRELWARKLSFDAYSHALVKLADGKSMDDASVDDDWTQSAWEQADTGVRFRSLQRRLTVLERRVTELEARK